MATANPLRIAFALSGFHRVDRGAEIALLAIAEQLARRGHHVEVYGSGKSRDGATYTFRHVAAVVRERFEKFPTFPPLRSDVMWEDATFSMGLLSHFRPDDHDVVVTCSFPFAHLAIGRKRRGKRPARVFVTQNGDWPARAQNAEYRLFDCDGLICINPDYFEANRQRWNCALIPNGADLQRFASACADRATFGIPADRQVVLMVSAFIESKRVLDGIRAVARLPDAQLVVAGDGALRADAERLANQLLPHRFQRVSVAAAQMPALYKSADCFLHMSLFESFGNVFVEAMASGLPIIANDTARLRWVVGDAPFLCDASQLDQVANALQAGLRGGFQPPSADLARFSWPVIAEQYEAFFLELVAR